MNIIYAAKYEGVAIDEASKNILALFNVRCSLDWNDLKIGDVIIFRKVMSKYLTIGKEYVINRVDHDFKEYNKAWFDITNDLGKNKSLRKHAQGYYMERV